MYHQFHLNETGLYGIFCLLFAGFFFLLLNKIQFLSWRLQLSHVQVFSCTISPVCRLKYPYCCFSFQFSCFYCFSVYSYYASGVTGCSNDYFFTLLNVLLVSLYWSICVFFLSFGLFEFLLLYCHLQHHNDTIIKIDAERLLYKYMYLSLYCKGSKRVTQGLRVRGCWRSIFWPHYDRQRCCLSRSPDAQPEAQGPLCWVMAFLTASYQQLLWTPTHQGPKPLRPGVAFPTTSRLSSSPTICNSTGTWLPSWLRYIIIQRPHDHPLDLWNRMFNRHQAEVTVMQFTGHSLPVHQFMSVPWEFFSSSHSISQFPPTRFPLITAIRMCLLLPVHHLEWHLSRVEGQNTTLPSFSGLRMALCILPDRLPQCLQHCKGYWSSVYSLLLLITFERHTSVSW